MENQYTQVEIAKASGCSQSHISEVFNGKKPVGKKTAKSFSKIVLNRRWVEFMDMEPERIEVEIRKALSSHHHPGRRPSI